MILQKDPNPIFCNYNPMQEEITDGVETELAHDEKKVSDEFKNDRWTVDEPKRRNEARRPVPRSGTICTIHCRRRDYSPQLCYLGELLVRDFLSTGESPGALKE